MCAALCTNSRASSKPMASPRITPRPSPRPANTTSVAPLASPRQTHQYWEAEEVADEQPAVQQCTSMLWGLLATTASGHCEVRKSGCPRLELYAAPLDPPSGCSRRLSCDLVESACLKSFGGWQFNDALAHDDFKVEEDDVASRRHSLSFEPAVRFRGTALKIRGHFRGLVSRRPFPPPAATA